MNQGTLKAGNPWGRGDETRLCPTFARRTTFRVSGSVAAGAMIWPGKTGSPLRFPAEFFQAVVSRFGGSEVEVGASFSGPTPDSLGAFIQQNLPTRQNPAVYVAGLLIEEGYAERAGRGRIRFFPQRQESLGSGPGDALMSQQWKRVLRNRIEQLTENEAKQLLGLLEQIQARSKDRALIEALAGDPALVVSENELSHFEPFRPQPFAGKPISEIVIEDRR